MSWHRNISDFRFSICKLRLKIQTPFFVCSIIVHFCTSCPESLIFKVDSENIMIRKDQLLLFLFHMGLPVPLYEDLSYWMFYNEISMFWDSPRGLIWAGICTNVNAVAQSLFGNMTRLGHCTHGRGPYKYWLAYRLLICQIELQYAVRFLHRLFYTRFLYIQLTLILDWEDAMSRNFWN